jgi:hypothetical protein
VILDGIYASDPKTCVFVYIKTSTHTYIHIAHVCLSTTQSVYGTERDLIRFWLN